MAKEPKANWSLYTKAELVKMIKNYDKRQAVLLNRIAKLEATFNGVEARTVAGAVTDRLLPVVPYTSTVQPPYVGRFPWQDVLDATKAYNSKEPK